MRTCKNKRKLTGFSLLHKSLANSFTFHLKKKMTTSETLLHISRLSARLALLATPFHQEPRVGRP